MMHGTKPTRSEMLLLRKWSLNPRNWLICKRRMESTLLCHRHTGSMKEIPEGFARRAN